MLRSPVLRREGALLQHEPEVHAVLLPDVFLCPERGPHVQIVDELEKLVVCRVPDDGRQDFHEEAVLDAVRRVLRVVVVAVVALGGRAVFSRASVVVRLSLLMARAFSELFCPRLPEDGFAHVAPPVQVGPEAALDSGFFKVGQGQEPLAFRQLVSFTLCLELLLGQELFMPLEKDTVIGIFAFLEVLERRLRRRLVLGIFQHFDFLFDG